jgi:hypothetical protein
VQVWFKNRRAQKALDKVQGEQQAAEDASLLGKSEVAVGPRGRTAAVSLVEDGEESGVEPKLEQTDDTTFEKFQVSSSDE